MIADPKGGCYLKRLKLPDWIRGPLKHQETVTIGDTVVARDAGGHVVEKRTEKVVPYAEWDGRCRECFP